MVAPLRCAVPRSTGRPHGKKAHPAPALIWPAKLANTVRQHEAAAILPAQACLGHSVGTGLAFQPFDHPVAFTVLGFALVAAASAVLDRYALPDHVRAEVAPRSRRQTVLDQVYRLPVVGLVFIGFFVPYWRPFYATCGTLTFLAVFTAISRAKFEFIREPLLFSDIAMVPDLLRHKEFFYASWMGILFWAGALGYITVATTLYLVYEPSILPGDNGWLQLAGILGFIALLALPLVSRTVRRPLARFAAIVLDKNDIRRLTARLGTFCAITYHFLVWLGRERTAAQPKAEKRKADAVPRAPEDQPIVVVWQSESFMDMRHFGINELALPSLDRLRGRSVEWGRLHNIFEGGYTLRTEFSVITGLAPDELGADAHHPYLRAEAFGDVAWPTRLTRAGWDTHFIHPYDRRFFKRHKAIPALGFQSMTMREAFDDPNAGDGPYVTDRSLSERVLDFCAKPTAPQFLFAASIENHGPWLPGRRPGKTDPLDIYLDILERSDEALGFLADGLDRLRRPVWLVFYGDHPPIQKAFADPFSDPRTDYFIAPLGTAAPAGKRVTPREKMPWLLVGDALRHLDMDAAMRKALGLKPTSPNR